MPPPSSIPPLHLEKGDVRVFLHDGHNWPSEGAKVFLFREGTNLDGEVDEDRNHRFRLQHVRLSESGAPVPLLQRRCTLIQTRCF